MTCAPVCCFSERVAFHVVAVGMTAKDDLDVFDFESEFGHGVADHGIISLVVRVDEDVPLRCRHQKARERFRAHVVHVADDLVRRDTACSAAPSFRRCV